MSRAAYHICTYPGCTKLVRSGRCAQHRQINAGRNYLRDPQVQALYNSAEWRAIREDHLKAEPWCRECKGRGNLVRATDVDHITPHKGDRNAFFRGPFQSLCHQCHTRKTNSERRGNRGA